MTPHALQKASTGALLLFLLLTLFAQPARPAFASLSLEDERKLGREFHEKLAKGQLLLINERANGYLARIGERILAHSDPAPFEFTFSIIKSGAVNAFATPGGYVYVNQGLINLAENEAQLASVLAHEIAHVTGRHIAEIINKSKIINISTLAAILAGAFLGGGGELTAAFTGFSMAAATTLSLKYSREQEEAADRSGLAYLTAAGYDGQAAHDFMRIMRRFEFYSNTIPSYFLTHPGTEERSRYIDAMLQTAYRERGAEAIVGDLRRIQTILLLDAKPPDANLQHFTRLLQQNPDDQHALYGLALSEERSGMVAESLVHFEKALALAPDDHEVARDYGIALFKLGRLDPASRQLRRAVDLAGDDPNALLFLGRTLLAQGDAHGALRLFRRFEERRPDDPESDYQLAAAYGKLGHAGDSHYYFGLHFKKRLKAESALFHFRAALREYPQQHPRTKEIQQEIQALRRK